MRCNGRSCMNMGDMSIFVSLVGIQVSFGLIAVLLEKEKSKGKSLLPLAVASYGLGGFILCPIAFFSEKEKRSKMSLTLLAQVLLISLTGVSAYQALLLMGLSETSSSFSTAMGNLSPAIIFVMAWALSGGEVVLLKERSQVQIPLEGRGTEIWSANRNNPVGENSTVARNTQGHLALLESDGAAIWSSEGSVESMDLGETGNWVLYNTTDSDLATDNTAVWSSWQHPTNTLMIGQIFRTGQKLVSNASPTNSSEGRFSLVAEKGGVVLYSSPNSLPYWAWPFPGLSYQYIKSPCTSSGSGSFKVQIVFAADLISMGNIGDAKVGANLPNNSNGSSCFPTADSDTLPFHTFQGESRLRFLRLDCDGNLRAYMAKPIRGIMGSNPQVWTSDYELFPSCFNCSLPSASGPYGVCSNGQCSCPTAMFTMREAFQPDAGCFLQSPLDLTCKGRKGQQMVEVKGLDYYPNKYLDFNASSTSTAQQCKDLCLSKCACVASFFRSDLRTCLLTFYSVDTLQLVTADRRASYTAFLKV